MFAHKIKKYSDISRTDLTNNAYYSRKCILFGNGDSNISFKVLVNLPGVQRGWNCKRFCCLTNSYKQFDLFKFARADQTSTVANNNTSQACLDRCRI